MGESYMITFSTKTKIYIGGIILILLIVIVQAFVLSKEEPPNFVEVAENDALNIENDQNATDDVTIIYVDIKGAVSNPGAYQMEKDNRIQDAINLAGGALDNADLNQVNLAQRVYDEMLIYIPYEGEKIEEKVTELLDGKISINKATESQLTELNGIGPAKAKAIIEYRTENGYFEKIEDITNVPGIGENIFNQIKNQITVQ